MIHVKVVHSPAEAASIDLHGRLTLNEEIVLDPVVPPAPDEGGPASLVKDITKDNDTAAEIVEVDGTPMQGLVARLSRTPGRIRWSGRPLGADTDEVLR